MPLYTYDSSAVYRIIPDIRPWSAADSTTSFNSFSLRSDGTSTALGNVLTSNGVGSELNAVPGVPGFLTYQSQALQDGGANGYTCSYFYDYVYTDFSGRQHPLGITYVPPPYNYATGCGHFGIYNATSSGDGQIFVNPNVREQVPHLTDISGNQLTPDYTIEDTNGNYLNGSGRAYSSSSSSAYSQTFTLPGNRTYSFVYLHPPSGNGQPLSVTLNPVQDQSNENGTTNDGALPCPSSFGSSAGLPNGDTLQITLPNNQTYLLTFDAAYGLLKSIVYPTGSTVTYTWGNRTGAEHHTFTTGSASCGYTYDQVAIQRRTVSFDGKTPALQQDFHYTVTAPEDSLSPMGFAGTTSITTTDLLNAKNPPVVETHSYSSYTQNDPTLGEVQIGREVTVTSASSGTLLTETRLTDERGNLLADCKTTASGYTSGAFNTYDASFSRLTDSAQFDYGGGVTPSCAKPSGTPARETTISYASLGATPIGTGILNRPHVVTLLDHGTTLRQTIYGYDESAISSAPKAPSNHDDAHYGVSVSAPRGNLTSSTSKCLFGCSSDVVTSTVYDQTGRPVKVFDGKQQETDYDYTDNYTDSGSVPCNTGSSGSSCGNTGIFPTTTTHPAANGVAHVEHRAYTFTLGQLMSTTDSNSQTTSYCYATSGCSGSPDPLGRLSQKSYPDGGQTTIQYSDGAPTSTITTTVAVAAGTGEITQQTFDGAGHMLHTTLLSDPSGSLTSDMTYDGFGRLWTSSNPYRSTADATYGITTNSFDSLGRTVLQSRPDGSSLRWCYDGQANTAASSCPANRSATAIGDWTDQIDGRGNDSQRVSDSFGDLLAVIEPSISGNSGEETDYSYDASGAVLQVVQTGSPARVRTFAYDSLSRLISSTNPEAGTICYGLLQSNGTCAAQYDGNGNLLAKTDARGVLTNYNYDSLNRLTSKQYTTSTNGVDSTPSSCFAYDQSSEGAAGGNLVDRLAADWTQPGSCTAGSQIPSTALNWKQLLSYDAMGRILKERQCAVAPCSTDIGTMTWTYDLAGNVTSSDNGAGTSGSFGIALRSPFDGGGHLSSLQSSYVDATHPGVLFSGDPQVVGSPTYGPFGLTNATIGLFSSSQPGLLSRTRAYDSMGRVVDDLYTSSGSASTQGLNPVTLSLDANPVPAGVTAEATASCDSTCGTGSGTITMDGNSVGGFTYSANQSETMTLPTSGLAAGSSHQVQASFVSSAGVTYSSPVVNFTMSAASSVPATTMTASIENNPVPVGESGVIDITLSCTTSCGSAQGNFTVNGSYAGSFEIDENGTAEVYTSTSLPVGQYTVVLNWYGDGTNGAAQQTVTLTVQNPPLPTGFTKGAISPFIGNPQGDLVDLPQGEYGIVTITNKCQTDCGGGQYFVDGNFEGGYVLDNTGSASVYIYPGFDGESTVGTHQLTITYAGNNNWAPYNSPAIPFNVVDSSQLPVPPIQAAPLSSPVPAQTWSEMQISLGPNAASCGGQGQVMVDGQYSDTFFVQSDGTVAGNGRQYPLIRPVSAATHTLTVNYWGTNSCAAISQSVSFTAQ